jgi:rhodanese-related sulfurtransferase
LVHCASGVRSARACDKLNHLDFPNLYNLPGGFRAWAKAGKPVEK